MPFLPRIPSQAPFKINCSTVVFQHLTTNMGAIIGNFHVYVPSCLYQLFSSSTLPEIWQHSRSHTQFPACSAVRSIYNNAPRACWSLLSRSLFILVRALALLVYWIVDTVSSLCVAGSRKSTESGGIIGWVPHSFIRSVLVEYGSQFAMRLLLKNVTLASKSYS
jgi:hypothetical protein